MTYRVFLQALSNGWSEIYYEAPYHYSIMNIEKKRIVTYCEGDVYDNTYETIEELIEEAQKSVDFMIKHEHPKAVYGEWDSLKATLEAKAV